MSRSVVQAVNGTDWAYPAEKGDVGETRAFGTVCTAHLYREAAREEREMVLKAW